MDMRNTYNPVIEEGMVDFYILGEMYYLGEGCDSY